MNHRKTALFAALLVLAARAPAQDLWEPLDGASGEAAAAAFSALHGTGWSVWRDPVTRSPSLIAGPGLALGAPLRADEAGIARARGFLEEFRELLGVDDPAAFELERCVMVPNPYGHELVAVNFKQVHDGLDVWHQSPGGRREHRAEVRLVFNGTLGRLVLLGSDAVSGLSVPAEATLGEAEAIGRALATLGAAAGTAERVSSRSYVSVRGERRFLAREVRVVTSSPPHEYRVIFDAGSGAHEETMDEVRANISGILSGGVLDFPSGSFTTRPLPSVRVTEVFTQAHTFTNPGGYWEIVTPPFPPTWTVFGGAKGSWADVVDSSGNGNISFNLVAPNNNNPVLFTLAPSQNEFETAEVSAYYWATTARNFVNSRIPGFNGLSGLSIDVNRTDFSCNAFASASGLFFARATGACSNSAYQEVVVHEYGHAFHRWFHGSFNPDDFSEAIGDHLALYQSGQRIIGRNFFTGGGAIRDYRFGGDANLTQWPSTNPDPHKRGEAWAGCTMDLRDNLIARLGPFIGTDRAELITIAQYAFNPSDEVSALLGVYLVDDNDAILTNGTPSCVDITAAARRHSLPVPWMIPVSCGGQAPPRVPEFRTPGSVPGLNSLSTADAAPVLDSSQRNIWWIAGRSGGVGGLDIWTASRSSVAGAWGNVRNEAALNSSGTEFGVTVEGDGLTIVFSSDRPGGPGSVNLWYSKRPSIGSPWFSPALVPGVNTASYQDEPSISPDGTEMFFTANGPGTMGPTAIWTSTFNFQTGAWNPPTRIAELDTMSGEYAPAISADGTRLYFTSDRPGGAGGSDLYIARRTARGQPWTYWRRAAELDTTGSDYGGCETSDGFSYYFSRNADLYRADRIYPRLLGPTSGRANTTATFTLRRDPGNLGLVAIGVDALPPTPAPPVLGDLLLVPLVLIVNQVHDANGNVTFTLPIANAPGAVVRFQGMSQDSGGLYYLSNRVDFLHLP